MLLPFYPCQKLFTESSNPAICFNALFNSCYNLIIELIYKHCFSKNALVNVYPYNK
jgi:hypothetical protein